MAMTRKALHEALRKAYMDAVGEYLGTKGEEILITNSNELSIPCVDAEGNDEFMVITFKVPTGSRDDGEPYDGYERAEAYKEKVAKKAEDAKAKAEAKARKIARDTAQRKAKAEAKAKAKAEKGEA